MPAKTPSRPAAKKTASPDAAMLRIVARHGTALRSRAAALGIDPAVAAAVLQVESGGTAFHNVGGERKATIRFENHVFWKHFTREGKDKARQAEFAKHFQYDPDARWKNHRWRASETGAWIDGHRDQTGEYAEFEYARTLDEDAAYRAISVGMGQILGEGFALAGKKSAKELYESFDSGENAQIDGTFAFIKNKANGKALQALRAGDFSTFVAYYNGSKKGGDKNKDYTQKLNAAAAAYRRVAEDPDPPLGPSLLLRAESRAFPTGAGLGEEDPLARMGYRHPQILPTLNQDPPPPPAPDPRQLPFARKWRQASTGITVAGVGAAGVKIGLAHAGGFATAVTSLGLAGGVLGLLNFATKVADGTLNDPLAEQTLLKRADRLGTLGAWLERHEEGVRNAAVASNWMGGAAAAMSVASGTMALTGVGLPIAAVLGGMALGLTVGSVVANPVGVVGVGLNVYDGLKTVGHMAARGLKSAVHMGLVGLDGVVGVGLNVYDGLKTVGHMATQGLKSAVHVGIGGLDMALYGGIKAAGFAKDQAKKGWDWAGGQAQKATGVMKAGASWVAHKGQQAAKGAGDFAKRKGGQALDWFMQSRPWLTDFVGSVEADLSAVSLMGFAAAAAMAAAGLAFPPILPVAAMTAGVADLLSVASGAAGLLRSGLILAGTMDGSVTSAEASRALGESLVGFAASFFGGKAIGRLGKGVKARTKAEGQIAQGAKKLGATSGAQVLSGATGADPEAPYAAISPFLARLQGMMTGGLERFLGNPYARLTPFYPVAFAAKQVLNAAAQVNRGLTWLSDKVGRGIDKGAHWVGEKAVGAAHFAQEKASGAWAWTKAAGKTVVDKGYDLAGAGIAGGFKGAGAYAHRLESFRGSKTVAGIKDGGLTGVFPETGGPADPHATDAQRHAAIADKAIIFVNGIANTLESHEMSARRLAQEKGRKVVGVFNASGTQPGGDDKGKKRGLLGTVMGYAGDIVQSVDDTTSIDSFNPAIGTMTDLIVRYGDPKSPPDGKLDVVAHSQGSIILSKALWRASKDHDISKVDATTLGNATFFFPKGANYHHYVFDDDLVANKLGTNSGAEGFFNRTRLGKAVSKHTARNITGRDNPEVDDAVAHTTILHQGGSGIRPHGMIGGWDLDDGGKRVHLKNDKDEDTTDGKPDYVSSLPDFMSMEAAQAGTPKAPQTERGRIGVANAFRKTGAGLLHGFGRGMQNMGLPRSGGLVSQAGAQAEAKAHLVDAGLSAKDGAKVQRRTPDAGPEPDAGGTVARVLASGDGHRTVDAPLAAKLGMGPGMSGVRLHAGPAAAEAARGFGAHAFATGRDVFFGSGRFDPHTTEGQGLLAHELTHVAQQTGDDARFYTPSGGDAMERQAQAAERALVFRSTGNLSVGRAHLDLDEASSGHADRLADLTALAIEAAGAELGDRPGEIESLSLDVHLDVQKMSDAEIVNVLRREIVKNVLLTLPPSAALSPAAPVDKGLSGELSDAPPGKDSRDRVQKWLKAHGPEIAEAEARYDVDRRAIAGPIAWEALENPQSGFAAKHLYGPGKFHPFELKGESLAAQVEAGGYLDYDHRKPPPPTPSGLGAFFQPVKDFFHRQELGFGRFPLRSMRDPDTAIRYIGAAMHAFVEAGDIGGYDLRCRPEILATFYNSTNLKNARDHFSPSTVHGPGQKHSPEALMPNDTMGKWVQTNLPYLEQAVGRPAIDACQIQGPPVPSGLMQRKVGDALGSGGATSSNGLPPALRSGIEAHSGFDMSAVQVHYNSAEPARVGALAYAQATDIHLGPGQERHLPHEAWHVVQQMQGRVRPTVQAMGASINDDPKLEAEAESMPQRFTLHTKKDIPKQSATNSSLATLQRVTDGRGKKNNYYQEDPEDNSLHPVSRKTYLDLEKTAIKSQVDADDIYITNETGFIYFPKEQNENLNSWSVNEHVLEITKRGIKKKKSFKLPVSCIESAEHIVRHGSDKIKDWEPEQEGKEVELHLHNKIKNIINVNITNEEITKNKLKNSQSYNFTKEGIELNEGLLLVDPKHPESSVHAVAVVGINHQTKQIIVLERNAGVLTGTSTHADDKWLLNIYDGPNGFLQAYSDGSSIMGKLKIKS